MAPPQDHHILHQQNSSRVPPSSHIRLGSEDPQLQVLADTTANNANANANANAIKHHKHHKHDHNRLFPANTNTNTPELPAEEWEELSNAESDGSHIWQPRAASPSQSGSDRTMKRSMLFKASSIPPDDHAERGHADVTDPSPTPTWANMPNKGQLAILAASRFVDFFQMAALQTFMVHQLKSFDPELSDVVISHQAGVLQGAFTAAQIVTSILWGRAADQPSLGRKTVLQIGLIGTGFGCIAVGFSKTYGQAVFWRLLSGAVNGTVGSARTMVAEITPKPWHPRAFLLLPAAFNVANVAGPILAGLLTDPVVNLPRLFGPGSVFGGETGVVWMKNHPYAPANLTSTGLLFAEALLVHFFLQETLNGKSPMPAPNPIAVLQNWYRQAVHVKNLGYKTLQNTGEEGLLPSRGRDSMELVHLRSAAEKQQVRPSQRLSFSRIWTPNVLWTLLSIAIFDFHMGAFANLWILFLATPREFIADYKARSEGEPLSSRSILKFSSGLAFPPASIGFAMAIIGFIGVALQFFLYPWANGKFGLMRCFRMSLFLFPAAYCLAPYLALLPSTTTPPEPAAGIIVWLGISVVLLFQVAARTFALPASIILLNNSSPHPSVLATIHGVGNACSATFRTIGPMLAGYWFGTWTERGIIGMAWWTTATIAAFGCVASFKVRNGSGHEVFLPGEENEMKEFEAGPGRSGDGR